MIKKAVIFLALLGACFFTLYSLVETKVKNEPNTRGSPRDPPTRDPAGPRIVLPTEGGSSVEWKPSGAWKICPDSDASVTRVVRSGVIL